MNRNLTFTLSFNLVSETTGAIERLYEQNDPKDFSHLIVDCDFPLLEGDKIPDDIEEAKKINTDALIKLSQRFGCDYLKIKNEGVSQNWTSVYNYLEPDDSDVMTCVEPDEIAIEHHWVKALGEVLKDERFGYAAPTLIDNKEVLKKSRYAELMMVSGYNIYRMLGSVNYGLLGISGRLLNKMGEVRAYAATPIYGNLESVLLMALKKYSIDWCILKDFTQAHTNVPLLYRAWKDDQIFGKNKNHQIPFEEWLIHKRDREK